MKVLINSINYWPELTGIGKYTGEMAEWLAAQGHDVYVVTAPPYYPAWKVAEGYRSSAYKTEQVAGVTIIRCPVWVPPSPTGLTRIIHLLSFAMSSMPVMLWLALTKRPDVVQVIEPPVACTPVAWLSAKLAGAFSWLHIQDFEVDAAFELNILPEGPVRKVVEMIERLIMRRFDRVSTISEKMLERLVSKGIDPAKQFLFENWTDIDAIQPIAGINKLGLELNIDANKKVLLYSGNMGKKQGLEILVELAKGVQHREDIILLLCGDGVMRPELEHLAQGLSNIQFLPLQPMDRLNELLNIADIHLLPQRAGAEDLVMPSKLTNMLSSGKPVIATVGQNTQVASVVKLCGAVVSPDNAAQLCQAVIALIDDPEKSARLGAAGRRYAEQNWELNAVLHKAFVL